MTLKDFFWGKRRFWTGCRENLKRRSWTVLLCILVFFLGLPVRVSMNISVFMQNLKKNPRYYGSAVKPEEFLKNAFLERVSFDGVLTVAALVFAVLLAVQGFAWINSRKKLDLYLSVPVSSKKRYLVIYINGILIFAFCYLAALLITFFVGTLMGVASGKALAAAAAAFACNLLFFAAVYHLTLIAVMLTGNVLVTLLGTGVFFLYEYMIRMLLEILKKFFFRTFYYTGDEGRMVYTSPVFTYLGNIWAFAERVNRANGLAADVVGRTLLILILQMAGYGVAAYLLYRKRGAEAAGMAVAFPKAKSAVKLLLMVPATLLSGMAFRSLSSGNLLYTCLGMGIGLLLSHGLIQIIYEFDVRSVLKKKWHLLAAGVASVLIFAVFYFDLTGYDAYIPKEDEVRTVAVSFENESYSLNAYERPFEEEIYYSPIHDHILGHMHSDSGETIRAVCTLAAENRERQETGSWAGGRYLSLDIKYELKSGRVVYRTILLEPESASRQLDVIFADRSFQDARYQIRQPVFMEHADELTAVYDNGLDETGYLGDISVLLETVSRDLENLSYSMLMKELPVGRVTFRYEIPGEEGYYQWSYPVYETFEDTVALLKEQDACLERTENGSFLDPEDVLSVTLTCYNLRDEDVTYSADGASSICYSDDRTVTETFTDQADMEQILPALYPGGLADSASGSITGRLDGDNYEVMVTFRQGVSYRYRNKNFFVLEEKLPEAVKEKMQPAGETE